MKSCAPAIFDAAITSSTDASGRAYRMLSSIVPIKRNVSCDTIDMFSRSTENGRSFMFTPSISISPALTSYRRISRFASVDFPEPV